jgi:pseudaminic acid cytidylyltransferase
MYLAIIPARAGSKRIKNKNIKIFLGYPIIRYSIHQALQSKLFKKIIVSTDSNRIKKIAINYGASVPFLRTKKLSRDHTPIYKVLLNVLKKIKKDFFPKYFCLIYATAPLIDKKDIVKSINYLKKIKTKADGICSICKYDLPVQRALKVNNNNFLEFVDKRYALKRSQDLQEVYYDAAVFSWYNTKNFVKKNGTNLKILPYFLPSNKVQDIDVIKDFKIAELKYKFPVFFKNK